MTLEVDRSVFTVRGAGGSLLGIMDSHVHGILLLRVG